jgi:hypothetical protein
MDHGAGTLHHVGDIADAGQIDGHDSHWHAGDDRLVGADHVVAIGEQIVHHDLAETAAGPGDEYAFLVVGGHGCSLTR